jgi:diguanylate cyclase
MNHRNRTIGFVLVLLTLAAHMRMAGVPSLLWVALPVTFLGWPVAAYRLAVKSASPWPAELWNLRVDALIYGAWASALGFPLWIAFVLFVAATVNLTAFAGVAGLLQATAIFVLGALPSQASQGGADRP